MKLVIDERVKHRLIGLAVILSIAAIFAPAIMKKSSQRLDGNVSVSVELPPKPIHPDIALTEKKALFEQVKLAQVELPEAMPEQELTRVAKAEPLSRNTYAAENPPAAATEVRAMGQAKPTAAVVQKIAQGVTFSSTNSAVALAKPVKAGKVIASTQTLAKPVVAQVLKNKMKGSYAVQLATFSQQRNAESLISRLKTKGYQASYSVIKLNDVTMYKVVVGKVDNKEQAVELQKRLVSAVQMKGMIVATGQG